MSWASVIWTAISALGIYVSIKGLQDIAKDRHAIGSRDGAYRMLVSVRQRRRVIQLVAFVVYAVVGVESMLPLQFAGEDILLVLGVFGGLLALILSAFLEEVDRAAIRRLFP